MSIKVKEYNAQLTTITNATLNVAPLWDDKFVAYQLITAREYSGSGDFPIYHQDAQSSVEGIAYIKDVKAFLKSSRPTSDYFGIATHNIPDRGWIFFTKEGRDCIAKHGFHPRSKPDQQAMNNSIIKKPYSALMDGLITPEDLVHFNQGDHMMFNADLDPLPVAIDLDYIYGRLDNQSYDLEKAWRILAKRTDIQFLNDRGDVIKSQKGRLIQSIPYYNREQSRDQYLHVRWSPSMQDMKILWEKCKELRASNLDDDKEFGDFRPRHKTVVDCSPITERHRAIFEADLLGLRAGGAAKFQNYYQSYDYESQNHSSWEDNDD